MAWRVRQSDGHSEPRGGDGVRGVAAHAAGGVVDGADAADAAAGRGRRRRRLHGAVGADVPPAGPARRPAHRGLAGAGGSGGGHGRCGNRLCRVAPGAVSRAGGLLGTQRPLRHVAALQDAGGGNQPDEGQGRGQERLGSRWGRCWHVRGAGAEPRGGVSGAGRARAGGTLATALAPDAAPTPEREPRGRGRDCRAGGGGRGGAGRRRGDGGGRGGRKRRCQRWKAAGGARRVRQHRSLRRRGVCRTRCWRYPGGARVGGLGAEAPPSRGGTVAAGGVQGGSRCGRLRPRQAGRRGCPEDGRAHAPGAAEEAPVVRAPARVHPRSPARQVPCGARHRLRRRLHGQRAGVGGAAGACHVCFRVPCGV
mmetsp:Transcript_143/g.431  ORF Transcript_143/g.431 Transcript_143/m.431 type:complete len:366 (+) Transcript_143:364-1461(+)